MVTSVACLVGAVVLMLLAPRLLTRGTWQVRRPRTALGLWVGTFFLGTGLVAGSVLAAVITASRAATSPSSEGAAVTVFAWVGLTAVGAAIGLVSGLSEPLATSHRRAVGRLAPVATSREDRGPFTLVRFSSDELVAIAVPGRRAEILLSSAMTDVLSPAQLRAVLAHEYAHLRHHHGLVVRIAELNALVLPRRLAAGAALRRATLLLVELIADDVAARQAGAPALAGALRRIGHLRADPRFELRAQRLVAFRADATEPRGLPQPVQI